MTGSRNPRAIEREVLQIVQKRRGATEAAQLGPEVKRLVWDLRAPLLKRRLVAALRIGELTGTLKAVPAGVNPAVWLARHFIEGTKEENR